MADRDQSDHIWDSSGQINSTGSANAYVIATAEPIAGYFQGMPPIRFKANFANTGSATANINGLGAVTLKKNGGASDLASGDIANGGVYTLIYDGTNFQVLELNAAAIVGVTDGDKGDITVSSNGTVWTIDAGAVPMTMPIRFVNITGGLTIAESDRATAIHVFAGTDTITFPASSGIEDDFYCVIANTSNEVITLARTGSDTIDGGTGWAIYPGGVVLVQRGAGFWDTLLLAPMKVTFTASGTLVKPGARNAKRFRGLLWGQGGGGARGGSGDGGGGGGGGACVPFDIAIADMGATETVTIGNNSNGATADNTNGSVGANSSIGSLVTAYGGGGGFQDASTDGGGGGGGGGALAVGADAASSTGGNGGAPGGSTGGAGNGGAVGSNSGFGGGGGGGGNDSGGATGGNSAYGGGGGGGASNGAGNGGAGGASLFGGGGGGGGSDGGSGGAGGTSVYGGNGGAGATGAANATAGSARGGGGGGAETGNGGNGGRGELSGYFE